MDDYTSSRNYSLRPQRHNTPSTTDSGATNADTSHVWDIFPIRNWGDIRLCIGYMQDPLTGGPLPEYPGYTPPSSFNIDEVRFLNWFDHALLPFDRSVTLFATRRQILCSLYARFYHAGFPIGVAVAGGMPTQGGDWDSVRYAGSWEYLASLANYRPSRDSQLGAPTRQVGVYRGVVFRLQGSAAPPVVYSDARDTEVVLGLMEDVVPSPDPGSASVSGEDEEEIPEDSDCMVCYRRQVRVEFGCLHTLCTSCVKRLWWTRVAKWFSCPFCRNDVKEIRVLGGCGEEEFQPVGEWMLKVSGTARRRLVELDIRV